MIFATLFMTVAAGIVALNSGYKGLLLTVWVLKPYPIQDQIGQNQFPIYGQNGRKTLLFGTTHNDIAHIIIILIYFWEKATFYSWTGPRIAMLVMIV